jgi:hypothetical protein
VEFLEWVEASMRQEAFFPVHLSSESAKSKSGHLHMIHWSRLRLDYMASK